MSTKEAKSILQLVFDFALFCLMIVGVGGVMYKVLMPGGWFQGWASELWQLGTGHALVFTVFALISFALAKLWLRSLNMKTAFGDLILYGWMALGLYFIVKLITTGSW